MVAMEPQRFRAVRRRRFDVAAAERWLVCWPLWPFALWTLYSWRHYWRRPHIALPLLLAVAGLAALMLASTPNDREFLIAIPALVVLAAFGVSSLKRTSEDAIDWFSLALFTLAFFALWLYAGAWLLGSPPAMAASVARLAPGFDPHAGRPTVLALAATLVWIVVVAGAARATSDDMERAISRGGRPVADRRGDDRAWQDR
jgi:hypothetical protein